MFFYWVLCVGQLLEIIEQFKSAVSTTLLGNIKTKVVKTILLITKQESIELQKLGHKFGSEGTLHKSKSRHPKYYLTESKKALIDLDKIKKNLKLLRGKYVCM